MQTRVVYSMIKVICVEHFTVSGGMDECGGTNAKKKSGFNQPSA